MSLYQKIVKLLAPKTPESKPGPQPPDEAFEKIATDIVAMYSKGSVCLQIGGIRTAEETRKETERVCAIDFSQYIASK
jgi:hypothetical protein